MATSAKESTLKILKNFCIEEEGLGMIKEAIAKALVPVTIITFMGICALAPLYVTLGFMTRQMTESKR